jgi:hypothetical protein
MSAIATLLASDDATATIHTQDAPSTTPTLNVMFLKNTRHAELSSLLFIPAIPTRYAVGPLILLGLGLAELGSLIMTLILFSRYRKSVIFILIALGTSCLFASTVFYARFIVNITIQTEETLFDASLDAFMISFFSGLMLLFVHAVDVAVVHVFYEVIHL